MRNLVPGWIWELVRRREVAAAAVFVFTGGLIWLAAHDPQPAVQENSLDTMRFGNLSDADDDTSRGPAVTQTTRRIPPVDETDGIDGNQAPMSAWMLSNAALDLKGEFVPPPIQVALTRSPPTREPDLPRQSQYVPEERVIQQLHMEDDPSIPTARLTGVYLDEEAAGR